MPDFVYTVVEQIEQWPVAVLLIAFLVVFGWLLKMIPWIPNKTIPLAVVLMGAFFNTVVGSVTEDPNHSGAYVFTVLFMSGTCKGFLAWGAHAVILRRLEKYLPFLDEGNRKGDEPTKPPEKDETKTP